MILPYICCDILQPMPSSAPCSGVSVDFRSFAILQPLKKAEPWVYVFLAVDINVVSLVYHHSGFQQHVFPTGPSMT